MFCFLSVCAFVVESNGRNDDDKGDVVDEDIFDITMFEGPTLPVTCASGSGILHKYRFATGVWVGLFKKIITTNIIIYIVCVGQLCFTCIATVAPKIFEHFRHT